MSRGGKRKVWRRRILSKGDILLDAGDAPLLKVETNRVHDVVSTDVDHCSSTHFPLYIYTVSKDVKGGSSKRMYSKLLITRSNTGI